MPFQILALSGGGYLGLYTAEILARLEAKAGKPLARCFDLVSGTSIGGILAIGLAFEIPAPDMRDMFVRKGGLIFSARPRPRFEWWDARRSLLWPKYTGIELKQAVAEMIGADTKLGQAKHRLLVPSVNMTKGSVQMFKTGHHLDFIADPEAQRCRRGDGYIGRTDLFSAGGVQNCPTSWTVDWWQTLRTCAPCTKPRIF